MPTARGWWFIAFAGISTGLVAVIGWHTPPRFAGLLGLGAIFYAWVSGRFAILFQGRDHEWLAAIFFCFLILVSLPVSFFIYESITNPSASTAASNPSAYGLMFSFIILSIVFLAALYIVPLCIIGAALFQIAFSAYDRHWRKAGFNVIVIIVTIAFLNEHAIVDLMTRYPVRITFDFVYGGRRYQPSFLTMMRPRYHSIEFETVKQWTPENQAFLIQLDDGSGLEVYVDSPMYGPLSQLSHFGLPHVGDSFDTGHFRWVWIDNPSNPRQIEMNDYGKDLPVITQTRIIPLQTTNAHIERIESTFRDEAETQDRGVMDNALILASSFTAPSSSGRLFAELTVSPAVPEKIAAVKNLPDWGGIEGGCRVSFPVWKDHPELNGAWARKGYPAMLVGDTWMLDKLLVETPDIVFPTGTMTEPAGRGSWNLFDYVWPITQQVRKLRWQDHACVLTDWPQGHGLIIDFGGDNIMRLIPGLAWAVLHTDN